jgi:hypothetical protein
LAAGDPGLKLSRTPGRKGGTHMAKKTAKKGGAKKKGGKKR